MAGRNSNSSSSSSSSSSSTAGWQILLLLALTAAAAIVSADACRASYDVKGPGKPLLFGGLMQAGRCNSGCQPRNSDWARRCQWDRHGSVWGVCSPQQAARSLAFAKTLGGGSILGMSPCDIMPYLQGRTLWLIGDSHSKVLYRALGCFLIDFHGQKECEPSSDAAAVQQLRKLPAAPGQSKCLHLLGGGRICIVHAALGTALVNNKEVAAGGVMPLLRAKFAQPQDIFYVSYGSWHGKSPAYWAALRPAMAGLAADYRATKSRFPHVLFREQPAYHKADASKQFCTPAKGERVRDLGSGFV
uniref:Uncharacterized protein n=1 Tax=Tetradesmus obliquus TaxID=3088 RepID=A0A383VEF6_TETOB|eukprot:jgi/Sobl393_1/13568/SZX63343.1